MARINQLIPKRIINEEMVHDGYNKWTTQQPFFFNSLEVFWNGQKLYFNDYNYINDQTIEIIGASGSYNDNIVNRDIFICNYLIKV